LEKKGKGKWQGRKVKKGKEVESGLERRVSIEVGKGRLRGS